MFEGRMLSSRSWLTLVLSAVQLAVQAQSPDGGYDNLTAWTLGETVPGVSPASCRTEYKENHEEVTFLDKNGKRIKELEGLWGVVWNDTLYLRIDQKHFVKMKEMGVFCYFTGPQYEPPEAADRVGRNTGLFGLVGGGFTVAEIDAKYKGCNHYVMNMRTGIIHLLEWHYMRIVLDDFPDLLSRFNAEPDMTSVETMLRYLREANKLLDRSH